jgi:hypothetical protein
MLLSARSTLLCSNIQTRPLFAVTTLSFMQQELSVWAEVANQGVQQQQQLVLGLVLQAAGSGDSVSQVAEGVGLAARRIVSAYKGVNAALEGFGCIMKQHQALQVRGIFLRLHGRIFGRKFGLLRVHGSGSWCCRGQGQC